MNIILILHHYNNYYLTDGERHSQYDGVAGDDPPRLEVDRRKYPIGRQVTPQVVNVFLQRLAGDNDCNQRHQIHESE